MGARLLGWFVNPLPPSRSSSPRLHLYAPNGVNFDYAQDRIVRLLKTAPGRSRDDGTLWKHIQIGELAKVLNRRLIVCCGGILGG
jgi:hypothetical protein